MKTHIDKSEISNLLSDAQNDGVQKLVVGAVIRLDGKFLLLERLPSDFMGGLVELASGTVDAGEDLLTALARETEEETNLFITSVHRYLGSFDYKSGSGKKTRQFNFDVEVAPGNVVLSPTEHRTYWLIDVKDNTLAGLNVSEAVKHILAAAQNESV